MPSDDPIADALSEAVTKSVSTGIRSKRQPFTGVAASSFLFTLSDITLSKKVKIRRRLSSGITKPLVKRIVRIVLPESDRAPKLSRAQRRDKRNKKSRDKKARKRNRRRK